MEERHNFLLKLECKEKNLIFFYKTIQQEKLKFQCKYAGTVDSIFVYHDL